MAERTFLIGRKHYRASDKKLPADVKAKISSRQAELDEKSGKTTSPVQASDIDPKYGGAPVDDDLPEDFPGLTQLRAAGYSTYADLADLEDYTVIQGVGPVTSKEIAAALKEREG